MAELSANSVLAEHLHLNIEDKLRSFLSSRKSQESYIHGSDSLISLSLLILQSLNQTNENECHLIVVEKDALCHKIKSILRFFDPNIRCQILPHFDVELYSNLYPNPKVISKRLGWLHHAQQGDSKTVFIASIESLLQKTLPYKALSDCSFQFKINTDLPEQFHFKLDQLGYSQSPVVEDVGQYSIRGGVFDIFSPAHKRPVRLELFGDTIDSIRFFDPETQRSIKSASFFTVIPAREVLFHKEVRQQVIQSYLQQTEDREVAIEEVDNVKRGLAKGHYFYGIDFLLPYFYDKLDRPIDHFSKPLQVWFFKPLDVARQADELISQLKFERESSLLQPILTPYKEIYCNFDEAFENFDSSKIMYDKIIIQDHSKIEEENFEFRSTTLEEFKKQCHSLNKDSKTMAEYVHSKFNEWKAQHSVVFISCQSQNQAERLKALLERDVYQIFICGEDDYLWSQWKHEQLDNQKLIHVIPRVLPESFKASNEDFIFLKDSDFFAKKRRQREYKQSGSLETRTHALSFGELAPGDLVVHKTHGIGVYEGLHCMPIQGVDAEFIQLKYKGGDKLYLPVYRVGQLQKYSGPGSDKLVDKLGGTGWSKTKAKVKSKLQDIAAELLKLYSARANAEKKPFSQPDDDFITFENKFPYIETEDQLRAIGEVLIDMTSSKPMDRLICGDVGFGKTEIAMRAAFKAVEDGRQVAVIAPTTILTFQHLKNFKKRFKDWPVTVKSLNRFVPKAAAKKTVWDLKDGKVDIVIGTHRLLSKDVEFSNLGLLIIDEEQKFGVKHKEKIRQLKTNVDTLAMSATPIPRTLNMSLVGIRDLSIINTPPVDRLPTRTFICKFDKETIRKAVMSEVQRGGQIFFLHNRVHSIYAVTEELRSFLPDVRIKVGHGQMDEQELEKTMLEFFNHEIDMLVSTTIIESGMDIPNANTIFIDNAHQLGLSQLYQLRGRVGRSKQRAYCYLIVPQNKRLDADAQERLKVIQEHTALGSGMLVAQHDLELRGAGDMLGHEQSGHANAVGYEMYIELLEDAIREQKGEPKKEDEIEPEINLRIQALIPDNYIPDIKIRLAYYKALSEIESVEDLDQIEEDFRDQFGKPPEPVFNLMGIMLIRKLCRDLGVKDITAGKNLVSLMFTDKTPLPPEKVIELTARENKKYSISPDQKLKIRMNTITWPNVYEELEYLLKQCPLRPQA